MWSFSLQELTCMHSVIWRCEHARFCVEVFLCATCINCHSFIYSYLYCWNICKPNVQVSRLYICKFNVMSVEKFKREKSQKA